ncbi:hypothetical protein PVAP13_9KG326032 [Panicum virgatum]|uniref:Uncharacterized protein n=1 Tax=Panicum virgatum TaxID=38727 RepID=A0A8T0NQT9_PANVG|nr:hypothetical protein PVAP13_9KG326032 [Panicum virgatum]
MLSVVRLRRATEREDGQRRHTAGNTESKTGFFQRWQLLGSKMSVNLCCSTILLGEIGPSLLMNLV